MDMLMWEAQKGLPTASRSVPEDMNPKVVYLSIDIKMPRAFPTPTDRGSLLSGAHRPTAASLVNKEGLSNRNTLNGRDKRVGPIGNHACFNDSWMR